MQRAEEKEGVLTARKSVLPRAHLQNQVIIGEGLLGSIEVATGTLAEGKRRERDQQHHLHLQTVRKKLQVAAAHQALIAEKFEDIGLSEVLRLPLVRHLTMKLCLSPEGKNLKGARANRSLSQDLGPRVMEGEATGRIAASTTREAVPQALLQKLLKSRDAARVVVMKAKRGVLGMIRIESGSSTVTRVAVTASTETMSDRQR